MGEIASEFVLNRGILKECREQLMLSLEEVAKKPGLKHIQAMEEGDKRPTYKQLSILASLYQVPRWVFISERLPEEYRYSAKPSFRKFNGSSMFDDSKIRRVVARVEDYRDLFIELFKDLGEPEPKFSRPKGIVTSDIEKTARNVRRWLDMEADAALNFSELKDRLEKKSIFVFSTSKYKGWSHIDKKFRGLSIIDDSPVPIIIINGSDSKKAYSFTLMHELGHILRGDMGIDGEEAGSSHIEKWCDNFAGEFLMPSSSPIWASQSGTRLSDIAKLAKQFKVSTYACLVRLSQLGMVKKAVFTALEDELNQKGRRKKPRNKADAPEKMKQVRSGSRRRSSRDISKELREQFGNTFINTVLSNWHNEELTLHKVTKILGLKQADQVTVLDESA